MKDCDSCEDIFKNTQENPCDNCEYRKAVAKAFDLHWIGWEDCPMQKCQIDCPISGRVIYDRD